MATQLIRWQVARNGRLGSSGGGGEHRMSIVAESHKSLAQQPVISVPLDFKADT